MQTNPNCKRFRKRKQLVESKYEEQSLARTNSEKERELLKSKYEEQILALKANVISLEKEVLILKERLARRKLKNHKERTLLLEARKHEG